MTTLVSQTCNKNLVAFELLLNYYVVIDPLTPALSEQCIVSFWLKNGQPL